MMTAQQVQLLRMCQFPTVVSYVLIMMVMALLIKIVEVLTVTILIPTFILAITTQEAVGVEMVLTMIVTV